MGNTKAVIVIEHDGRKIKDHSLHALRLADELGAEYVLLVIGHNVAGLASMITRFGAERVLVADDESLANPLADRYSEVVKSVVHSVGASILLGTSSTFTKDILSRAAALLNAGMLTDVVGIAENEGVTTFKRPVFSGNAIATVILQSDIRVMTIRASAFEPPSPVEEVSHVERVTIDADSLPSGTRFVSCQTSKTGRPDLTEARVVVAGGRPLQDVETFERLVGGLADALGGAVGTTRPAVDAGVAPNDWQIGQTGKAIAPDLYIGIGISGAIQHLAGIRDSRIIVAINKDPDAPIFQIANYGLIGDLHELVPELIAAVKDT